MARKPRVDNPNFAAKVAASASMVIVSSRVKLTENEKPFFDAIVEELPKLDWSPHKVDIAAHIAKILYDLTKNSKQADASKKWGTVASLRRSIGLHCGAKGGHIHVYEQRREAMKDIEKSTENNDELIARPN